MLIITNRLKYFDLMIQQNLVLQYPRYCLTKRTQQCSMHHLMLTLVLIFVLKQNDILDQQVLLYVSNLILLRKMIYQTTYYVLFLIKIQFPTREGRPGPVTNLRAVPYTSDGIFLLWDPPDETNGVIIGYQIDYKPIERYLLK